MKQKPNLNLSDDPRQRAAQLAMLKLLSTQPEGILHLFDRLGIPWQRVSAGQQITAKDDAVFVVKWKDLMNGEDRNKTAGPFIKTVIEEMKEELRPSEAPPEAFEIAPLQDSEDTGE